jgi:hypothetical protein
VWALCRDDALVYQILSSRSTSSARDLLGEYEGVVVCDGYTAYAALEKGSGETRAGPRIVLAHCWADVRRKFIDAERSYPVAGEMVERIGGLYRIEQEIREANGPDRAAYARERRQADTTPLMAEIRDWLTETRALPRSSLGKAIKYTAGIWPGLCRFLEDPAIPIDPTDAARTARGQRVGIEEREDGSLSFWHGEHELLATAFPKDHGVPQGEVVENKRLSAALEFIKVQQRERIAAKVAKPSTTRRDARLLRAGTPRRPEAGSSAEARL